MGIAKRQREPEVLTVEELKALFEKLEGIYRTMVFVGGQVGLRVPEVIGAAKLVGLPTGAIPFRLYLCVTLSAEGMA